MLLNSWDPQTPTSRDAPFAANKSSAITMKVLAEVLTVCTPVANEGPLPGSSQLTLGLNELPEKCVVGMTASPGGQ